MRLPRWTLLVCGAAVLVYAVPALRDALIYDRVAIGNGQWWRLVTGSLVHHSLPHLIYDVVALAVGGTLIELRRIRHFGLLLLLAGSAVGITLHFARPDMRYYGGLSGVATAAIVYLCLDGLSGRPPWRRLCLVVLTVVALKIGYETITGRSLVDHGGSLGFVPVPLAHGVGALSAVLLYGVCRLVPRIDGRR